MTRGSNQTDRRVGRGRFSSFILHPSSFRHGFTLVELLIVITIIGMLAALLSVAAVKAINTATNTKILAEINMLDTAMQSYKDNIGGGYPPDCTMLNSSQPAADRQNRIVSHVRKAFPRLIMPNGYGTGGTSGSFQYLVQNAFAYYNSNPPANSAALYSSYPLTGNNTVWGDINNLDPAEALVFWLGGPPAPPVLDPSTGKWLFTLRGFSASKVGNAMQGANSMPISFGPFSLTDASRVTGPYEFQQSRLGDADGDGWPEYYPDYGDVAQPPGSLGAVANPMPPYVYFDGTSYTSINNVTVLQYPQTAVYPSPASVAGGAPGLQPVQYGAAWGTAMPYPQLLNTNSTSGITTVQWVNPQKFQIVCSGIDQHYWFVNPSVLTSLTNVQLRPYPSGVFYSEGDLDNLTNFYTGMLKSAQP